MEKYQLVVLVTAIIVFTVLNAVYRSSQKRKALQIPDEQELHRILLREVLFYQKLDDAGQAGFRERVHHFLQLVRITPVANLKITKADKVLVAAAGIIPLFRFKNWMYNNLNEVLIYPDRFAADYSLEGDERNVLGMVGDGAMHRTMILSLPSLRAGFAGNSTGNTAIHEFVHLLDKSDGATDGIPEEILQHENVRPWIHLMHEYIREIRAREITDINPYGATNEAEFFAVVSEYFFQQPERLQENHPELYQLLDEAFNRNSYLPADQ